MTHACRKTVLVQTRACCYLPGPVCLQTPFIFTQQQLHINQAAWDESSFIIIVDKDKCLQRKNSELSLPRNRSVMNPAGTREGAAIGKSMEHRVENYQEHSISNPCNENKAKQKN